MMLSYAHLSKLVTHNVNLVSFIDHAPGSKRVPLQEVLGGNMSSRTKGFCEFDKFDPYPSEILLSGMTKNGMRWKRCQKLEVNPSSITCHIMSIHENLFFGIHMYVCIYIYIHVYINIYI